ncbi:hypothetical protein J7E97_31840 [Streptomyces sp. ISL-66]|uniref:hypothetical protein n=1 Tax=Streptomyces sp. ISL-66 TaxID=2819186 RepID=UPI001BEC46F0|nr:hypothetical protein [Streptomyces sp. ISL-66]MBT2472318.1 hypothetical protein [Streptomyces sp. ISL-66]
MSAERAQGRGWVRIPASRGEQPATTRAAPPHQPPQAPYAPPQAPYGQSSYARPSYGQPSYGQQAAYGGGQYPQAPYDPSMMIYHSLVTRWREAGRTLPGHPDEEWERLVSQPCWPGR